MRNDRRDPSAPVSRNRQSPANNLTTSGSNTWLQN